MQVALLKFKTAWLRESLIIPKFLTILLFSIYLENVDKAFRRYILVQLCRNIRMEIFIFVFFFFFEETLKSIK